MKRSGRGLGWLFAMTVVNMLLLCPPALALDLDKEIQKQELTAQEILPTIGNRHSNPPAKPEQGVDSSGLAVELIKTSGKRDRSS